MKKQRLRDSWTSVNGIRIHARISTRADNPDLLPVVLVHGLGVSSLYWVPFAERLAAYRRLYVPDLPGFGRSGKPPHTLSVPELADALAAWLQATGLQRAAFIGNSLGCQILVDLVLRYPHLAACIVLEGPTMDPRARTVLQETLRLMHDMVHEPPSSWFVTFYEYLQAGPIRTLQTLEYAFHDDMEKHLPHVHVPALVVRGAKDTIVPKAWAHEVAGLLPQGRMVVIPGEAHIVHYSAPRKLLRVVLPFLDRYATRPSIGSLPLESIAM